MLNIPDNLAPATEPWRLIREAIQDLEKQRKLSTVRIDMDVWYELGDRHCYQCLAGCVIAERLDTHDNMYNTPVDFEKGIADKLHAINLFRQGLIKDAYNYLQLEWADKLHRLCSITDYEEDNDRFIADMKSLADYLENFHREHGPPKERNN